MAISQLIMKNANDTSKMNIHFTTPFILKWGVIYESHYMTGEQIPFKKCVGYKMYTSGVHLALLINNNKKFKYHFYDFTLSYFSIM